jgi:hypothetical protein
VQRARVKLADDVDHKPRQVPLLDPIAHAHRHQEQLVALRAHVRARRPRRATGSLLATDRCAATTTDRLLMRHHATGLLTQAPAALISRKSPAQEATLTDRPDTTAALRLSPFPRSAARHEGFATACKSDVSDAAWLCRLAEAGMLKGELRTAQADPAVAQPHSVSQDADPRTRPRSHRLHKALEDAGIKLDCVAADVMGKSGRDMLDALVGGTTDPEVLAQLARRQMRKKIPQLREALEGHFDAHHALWIGAILAHIDFLDEQIDRLSDAIEKQIRPFAPAVELCTVVGIQHRGAECILAEIGADMTRFASPRHLASWAGQCLFCV